MGYELQRKTCTKVEVIQMSDDITMEIYEYLEQKEQFKTYQEAKKLKSTRSPLSVDGIV